jgi:hypothetical protein
VTAGKLVTGNDLGKIAKSTERPEFFWSRDFEIMKLYPVMRKLKKEKIVQSRIIAPPLSTNMTSWTWARSDKRSWDRIRYAKIEKKFSVLNHYQEEETES